MTLQISSAAFDEGQSIPSQFTCDGRDVSPPLAWSGVPEGARSLALICDDPDAPMGTWVHWVLFNIPPRGDHLDENIPSDRELPDGAKQGLNSWKRIGYGGPCPPGGTHRYFFKLHALDVVLDQDAGITKSELVKAMEGHILAEGRLMGRYRRP